MPRKALKMNCTEEQLAELRKIVSSQKNEQRIVRRAKMVLMCAEGQRIKDIAKELNETEANVIKWRDRYIEGGKIDSLKDKPRSGKPITYGAEFRKKALDKLSEKPPHGLARWDGPALAEELDTSVSAIWRLMNKEGIQLSRKRTWCVSTDPEFTAKAADIVGLYLAPPENAVVLCIDEKPSMQALSRTTGYVQTRNGKTMRAIKSTYRRNGTQNLFAALEVATGQIHGKTTKQKKRTDFLAFLDDLMENLPQNEEIEYHIIIDNYCIHKRCDEWLGAHKNVHFHFTPTSASWLNQVEIWFNIMTRKVLKDASFDSVKELCHAIGTYIEYYNESSEPFIWKKREVKGSQIKDNLSNLCD